MFIAGGNAVFGREPVWPFYRFFRISYYHLVDADAQPYPNLTKYALGIVAAGTAVLSILLACCTLMAGRKRAITRPREQETIQQMAA